MLYMELYYQLPDDFTGTFEDAILHYVNYRRDMGYAPNNPFNIKAEHMTHENMYEQFWNIIHTTELKSAVSCSFSELDPENNTWIDLLDKEE